MDRIKEWNDFSAQVLAHVEQYTISQYGSQEGTEQADNFSIEDCYQNILKYINRRNSGVRGSKESLRDILKIAHYACFIYFKKKAELGEEDLYE